MTVKTKDVDDRGEGKHVEGMAPSEASAFIPGAKPLIETLLVRLRRQSGNVVERKGKNKSRAEDFSHALRSLYLR